MKSLYLNQADGRKEKQLDSIKIKNPSVLYKSFQIHIRQLLRLSKNEFLGFAQNATSCIIFALSPILKRKRYRILVSNHEIRWYKDLFEDGKLPVKETTYPNYAPQIKLPFIKREISFFDPHVFIKKPEKFLSNTTPTIIVLSHVSRMTGELFATQKLYKAIKKINPENIVIIDGSQAVGILQFVPISISDIYIGITSKFIGAEPHIAFYWVSKKVATEYQIPSQTINPKLFSKEIYSAERALRALKKGKRNLSLVRKTFEAVLSKNNIPFLRLPLQAKHILLMPEKKIRLKKIVDKLNKNGIVVSSNIGYSICEPKKPAVRISIIPQLTKKQIEFAIKKIKEIRNRSL